MLLLVLGDPLLVQSGARHVSRSLTKAATLFPEKVSSVHPKQKPKKDFVPDCLCGPVSLLGVTFRSMNSLQEALP